MDQLITETGSKENNKEEEDSYFQTETGMKANGNQERCMDGEPTCNQMDPENRVFGNTVN